MSFYSQANSNPNAVQASLLGPSYSYKDQIKTPNDLGMSDAGNMDALGNDIGGVIGYVSLLVDGGGNASRSGRPLGNKYFLQTGAQCTAVDTQQDVNRYIYMNNVPPPPLPGLIHGIVADMENMNPFGVMGAFAAGSKPKCQQITMETIDSNNQVGQASHYVTLTDIKSMPDYYFTRGRPNLAEGFETRQPSESSEAPELPDDLGVQFYFFCLSAVGIYIMYRIMRKDKVM